MRTTGPTSGDLWLVLVVLLAAWVAGGGGGTLSRVRIRIMQAAVPMLSFTLDIAPWVRHCFQAFGAGPLPVSARR